MMNLQTLKSSSKGIPIYRYGERFQYVLLTQSHHHELTSRTRTALNYFHLFTVRGNSDYSNCSEVFALLVAAFKGDTCSCSLSTGLLDKESHQESDIFMKRLLPVIAKDEQLVHIVHFRHLPSLLA